MKEANDSCTNIHMLRKLFATIILKCKVSNHKQFYEKCKDLLSADYIHIYSTEFRMYPLLSWYVIDSEDLQENVGCTTTDDDLIQWSMEKIAANSSLCDLHRMLSEEDKSLEDFDLPIPDLCKEQHIQNCLMDNYV